MKFLSKFLLALTFLFLPLETFAWNALGHMIIANIAYQHMSTQTQQKVDKLLSYFNQEYPDINSFVQLAVWPDEIRGQKIELFTHWHYIDYSISTDNTPMKDVIDTDNAEWALNTLQPILKNTKANNFERARFLGFFIHITGDLHQPLHSVSNFTRKTPDGDKGGNLYNVIFKNERMNLHHLWDGGVGLFAGDSSPSQVTILSKRIQDQYPTSYFGKRISDLNPNHWTQECLALAKSNVYQTAADQPVSSNYEMQNSEIAEQQVALAGYRLANFLNLLLA